MVTMTQVKNGLSRYIDQEIMPGLTGINKFGAAVYLTLALDGAERKLAAFLSKPSMTMLDVMTDTGMVDIDRLKEAVMNAFGTTDKLDIEFPVIGRITFHREDAEKLYRLICE